MRIIRPANNEDPEELTIGCDQQQLRQTLKLCLAGPVLQPSAITNFGRSSGFPYGRESLQPRAGLRAEHRYWHGPSWER
jgi:hypothetical protein